MIKLLKDYANKRIELLKLDATEKVVLLAGGIVFLLLVIVFLSLFLLLFSLGLSHWLGHWVNSVALGYFLVAVIYLISAALCIVFKDDIRKHIADLLLKFLQ